MLQELTDFQDTQPLGRFPKVDLLVDPKPVSVPTPQRRGWRPIGSGLDLLRDLLTYRIS